MNLVWGAGMLALTALAFGWAYGVLRRTTGGWSDSDAAASAIGLALTVMTSVTLIMLVRAGFDLGVEAAAMPPLGWAAMAGGAVVVALALRWLAAPARRQPPANVVDMPPRGSRAGGSARRPRPGAPVKPRRAA